MYYTRDNEASRRNLEYVNETKFFNLVPSIVEISEYINI